MKTIAFAALLTVALASGCAAPIEGNPPPTVTVKDGVYLTGDAPRKGLEFGCNDPDYPVLLDASCNAAAGTMVDSHAIGENHWFCAFAPYDVKAGVVFRVEYTCSKP